ncbi:MAG TPA: ABC transporter permease [Candidatus Dormibacteraeota bacterium]|nr:ABC transporter permease [Candidatus Dormibacteraeota bacterium]
MLKYLLRRVLATIPVIIGVTVFTFIVMHVAAGSYVPGLDLNPNLKPEDEVMIKRYLGLDRPLHEQYLTWIAGVIHGDFGRSMIDGSLVSRHIGDRLPATLELTVTAILLGVLISIPLGVTGALRRGSKIDHALTAFSVGGFAIPGFWLGLMLILIFSVQLQAWGLPFLPSGGVMTPGTAGGDPLDRLVHLIMPATVLSFVYLSIWSRFTRSSMLEVLSQDYVRTARAKGMSERRVVYMHALRNAVIPLVTLVGLELPSLVAGGLVVEVVFSWPGIGKLLYERALQTDYSTVLGITTFAALLVVLGNLLADFLYALLDPRIRYA